MNGQQEQIFPYDEHLLLLVILTRIYISAGSKAQNKNGGGVRQSVVQDDQRAKDILRSR